ncbi:MAG: nitroreductase family deazaflavin-dependent oxidoreductase [Pseudonocardiales bacterium]|nr:MAG: nitroreductase family deazaflavin-dependent oxidoreductase [Pseudonocardiales bacterium]
MLTPSERFWRNRMFARIRHRGSRLRRSSSVLTRMHATLIRCSGGRIQRSFLFAGGMPILVLSTVGRKTGKLRSTPLAYVMHGPAFAVMASNAGSDQVPAWLLNLQSQPTAQVFVGRTRYIVTSRAAHAEEEAQIWSNVAGLNPGFDEYRHLTAREIPVVLLEPQPR